MSLIQSVSSVLDNPVYASLAGQHARFAQRYGDAFRYPADVSPFAALRDPADGKAWADAAVLVGPGKTMTLTGTGIAVPDGWEPVREIPGVQLVSERELGAVPDVGARIVRLGGADVPQMRALVARTEPGPFLERTYLLGTYIGIRHAGELVAMAGERMRPDGYAEISAVCTDARVRGRGYASALISAIAQGMSARGEIPFLHTGRGNTVAIRLYEQLGFRLRGQPSFLSVRALPPS